MFFSMKKKKTDLEPKDNFVLPKSAYLPTGIIRIKQENNPEKLSKYTKFRRIPKSFHRATIAEI